MDHSPPEQPPNPPERPSLLHVIWSIIAGLFGVQSAHNRKRDFGQGKAEDYILVYVVLVLTLIAGVLVAVTLVMNSIPK